MNESDRIEIEQALARFLDGEPEPSDGEILAAALRQDKEFEREFVRALRISDLLRQNALPDQGAFLKSLRLRLTSEVDGSEFVKRFGRRLNHEDSAERLVRRERRAILRFAMAMTLIVLMSFAALVGYQWRGANPRRTPISSDSAHGGEIGLANASGPPGTKKAVAVLTRVVNAHWNATDVAHNEGSALAPGRLQLESGLVQIEFLSGASVIIEGPCDFELLSPDKAVCYRGKVRAHVPPHARGFTVAAPGINAVDLGTEFAMSVDESGRGRVHVVEGEVELQGVGDHQTAAQIKTLKAGQGADFGLGGVFKEIAADPTDFVDRSRLLRLEDAHHLRRHEFWLAHSRSLRADPATVLYYSFEDNNTWERTLRNVAGGDDRSLNGSVVGCLWCPGRWLGKTALEFKRTSDRVRINVPGRFDQLSMATWVRVEGLNNWYSSLMLTDDWDPGDAHWQLTASGQIVLGVRAVNDQQHDVDYATQPILGPSHLGQWVHIATVYDKPNNLVAHYLNGNRVLEERLQYPITLQIGSASIGNWTQTRTPFILPPIRSLNGRIDEFVILRRVLSHDEVKRMYELGKPNS